MSRGGSRARMRTRTASGFTLIELLTVITIIAITLALLGPVLMHGSIAQREAARLLQGTIAGARDAAIGSGRPRGIRLVPDPSFPLRRLSNNQIDPSAILCASRIVSIESAPAYAEGRVNIGFTAPGLPGFPPSYFGSSSEVYPWPSKVLMVEECAGDMDTGLVNPPTCWFWNVRIGDRIRIGNSGIWYTVVGPMTVPNSEFLVNCGRPGVDFRGTKSPLLRFCYNRVVEVEFLFLVNGRDDDQNGYIDEGFDGIDNNQDGLVDEVAEWEPEVWVGGPANVVIMNAPYTISRRPVRSSGTRDVTLPSGVVIDLTTWGSSRERSRLPVNPLSGEVDILLGPDGRVVPSSIYSTPANVGLSCPFLHFWLADRADLFEPRSDTYPQLPLPPGPSPDPAGRELKGDATILSLNTRSGLTTTTTPSRFDTGEVGSPAYDASLPFRDAEQGIR
ncbi:MAG: type II secretion system protein [Isosphaeraceae bacterium]